MQNSGTVNIVNTILLMCLHEKKLNVHEIEKDQSLCRAMYTVAIQIHVAMKISVDGESLCLSECPFFTII